MRGLLISVKVTLFLIIGINSHAQLSKFQALYVINIAKNLTWSEKELTIGAIGNSKAINELEGLLKKYPELTFKKLTPSSSIKGCQILFLPSSESKLITSIQEKIGDSKVTLISESESHVNAGAEFAFYMEGNKLRFILNKPALDQTGVGVNEKLMSIAKVSN